MVKLVGLDQKIHEISLYDFSVMDLYIVTQLQNYSSPTLRSKILKDIQASLGPELDLTPTKFYYSLQKLEEKGLLESRSGERKNSQMVNLKEDSGLLVKNILKMLLSSQIDYYQILKRLNKAFFEFKKIDIANHKFEKLLLFLPPTEIILDQRKLLAFEDIAQEIYIVSERDKVEDLNKKTLGMHYNYLEVEEGRLRESNDYFDAVVWIDYDYFLPKEQYRKVLNESMRVAKEGALLVNSGIQKPHINHLMVNPFIEIISEVEGMLVENKEILTNYFKEKKLQDVGLFEFEGLVLGYATNS